MLFASCCSSDASNDTPREETSLISKLSGNEVSSRSFPPRTGKQTHVFLTHAWAKDLKGRDTHKRVSLINNALKKMGLITWFDEERMTGSIRKLMTEGVDNTLVMIVFITRAYVDKANGDDDGDNCRYEFTYSVDQRRPQNMVPVVMEPSMRNPREWRGKFSLNVVKYIFHSLSCLRPTRGSRCCLRE